MRKNVFCFIIVFGLILILSVSSCKTKSDDETAVPYKEQLTNDETAVPYKEQLTAETDSTEVDSIVTSDETVVKEDNTDEPEQKQDISELEPQEENTDKKTENDLPEQQSAAVYGQGILEYVDISKVVKMKYRCIGESLSNVTAKTVKTVTDEEQIKSVLDTLSKIEYTQKEKLYDKENGDYLLGRPPFYQLRLYDKNDELVYSLCLLDIRTKYKDDACKYDYVDNVVWVDNYEYRIKDSSSIQALVSENITENCDCLLCVSEYLVPALDCDACTAAKNGYFCTCE